MPGISVIICTFNRSQVLKDCLRALEGQTAAPSDYEVLIIDNNSTDDTEKVAQSFCGRLNHFHYLFAPKQGLAHARNVGLSHSKFEICAFSDDDALPPDTWISQLSALYDRLPDDVVCVGGEIQPDFESPRPSWLSDEMLKPLSAYLGWSKAAKFCAPHEWLCEVNCAYRKGPLVAKGGFPEHLGRIANTLLSGENAVNQVMQYEGGRLYFDPSIVVRHSVSSERLTKSWFRRRYFWQGVTSYYVGEYLKQFGISQPLWSPLEVPTNERSWMTLFNQGQDDDFEHSLSVLSNMGYLLASQQCISGR